MRKWPFLSVGLLLGFGSMAVAASITSDTQPNVGQSLVQRVQCLPSRETQCGRPHGCALGPGASLKGPGVWGVPLRTCITLLVPSRRARASACQVRCGPWVCRGYCP
jgi:hypothetical protein